MSTTSVTPPTFGSARGPGLDAGRLLVGLVIVGLGVVFLLDAAASLDAGAVLSDWWPAVVVAAGAVNLLQRPRAVIRALVLVTAGTVLLLFTTDVLGESAWEYVWPAALVVAGLAVIARARGRRAAAGEQDDVLRTTSVFGGAELSSASSAFRGAWVTAIFGGVELDLRGAALAPGGATVNATAALGGVDVLVPRGWKVNVRSVPIFGGAGDKTDHEQALPADAPVLQIDAVCIFGGVEVKHEK